MKYSRVHLESIAYELPPNVMTSATLEENLAPVYRALRLQPGQLEALTGISERRWWDAGTRPSDGASRAARKAMSACDVSPGEIGAIIYGGVCRDNLEPATACAVAHALGVRDDVEICDLSNACLGAMNGMIAVADKIELGRIRAGMVVCCESSREIIQIMIEQMLQDPTMEMFKRSLATLTGGSGAVAMILTDGSFSKSKPKLMGGVHRAAPEHHALCRWGEDRRVNLSSAQTRGTQYFETDAIEVLKHGVRLGAQTWDSFTRELDWTEPRIDRVIMHQVGSGNRDAILEALKIPPEKDFSTYEFLGNMGTVSLPLTAALAAERGFLERGDCVAFLGIGSGLNCLMLGWKW